MRDGAEPGATPLRLIHLSDTHLTGDGRPLYGVVDPAAKLRELLALIQADPVPARAIVITGDLADEGEPGAYERLRELVRPVAEELGAEVVWVCGNHDDPETVHTELVKDRAGPFAGTSVHDIDGLRIIALNSSVAGRHHGRIGDAQREWLASLLSAPSPKGTVIALHHPPIASPVRMFDIIGLRDAQELLDIVAGSDVRAILAGHFHHAVSASVRGIPVFVAGATSFSQDTTVAGWGARALDAGQSHNVLDVYADHITSSVAINQRSRPIHLWEPHVLAQLRMDETEPATNDERTS